LAFSGRSTGCSLTSTSTTSKIVSLDWSTFCRANETVSNARGPLPPCGGCDRPSLR
jgi:hypothetical protein